MKNKNFLLLILVAVVVILGSVFYISGNKPNVSPEVALEAVSFTWKEGESPVLMMKANRDLALDAVEIYLDYEGVVINSATNAGDLPTPSFIKVSTVKSQVVANYLISDPNGLVLKKDQSIAVLSLDIDQSSVGDNKISMNPQSQLVESKTSKVLPFNNQDLIIKSTR